MKRFLYIGWGLVLATSVLALWPVRDIAADWWMRAHLPGDLVSATPNGYDWVHWAERDGSVVAAYVFERGPADRAGLQAGDQLFMVDYVQYFTLADLQVAISGIPPGSTPVYTIRRDGEAIDAPVELTRHPTFLYPLSQLLWQFSLWGFTLGAFLHVLGLGIVGPLAARSQQARFSFVLILISSLWMVGNLARLLMVEVLGPPTAGSVWDRAFQMLTLVGLVGWIGFPALLLHKVSIDVGLTRLRKLRWARWVIYLPTLLLGAAAAATTAYANIGPLTQDVLVGPILFYACSYVAASAALVWGASLGRPVADGASALGWSRAGSLTTSLVALLAALSVLGIVPVLGAVTDEMVGWLIVGTQLLAIFPLTLVSLASLKHGRVDHVLSRGFAYLFALGLIFFAVTGGLALLDPPLERLGASRNLVAGLYVVALLLFADRIARRLRLYASSVLSTERQRARSLLNRFVEDMRDIIAVDALAQATVDVVGDAFKARSAVLYLRSDAEGSGWVAGRYNPEPPYLTERVVGAVWEAIWQEGRIWAANPEVNESALPPEKSALLRERGAALAVPIRGEAAPKGLLVLGPKRRYGAVYNLEDVEMLRALAAQTAIAVERLYLVEREKALVQQRAEAQLVALRAQINPHFLFNALNTIAALIGERPAEAEAMVEHLAAIFRHTLNAGSDAFLRLSEELRLVEHYLQIEHARFGERLRVEIQVDPAAREALVPAFVVQTLVENAVKHGLERSRGAGDLRVTAALTPSGAVAVEVMDSGVGIPALFGRPDDAPPHRDFYGIGLSNVASRLEQLYGRDDLLRLTSSPGEGTTAALLVPQPPPAGDGVAMAVAAPEQ